MYGDCCGTVALYGALVNADEGGSVKEKKTACMQIVFPSTMVHSIS